MIATSRSSGPITRYQSYTPGADAEGDVDALSLWAGQSVGLCVEGPTSGRTSCQRLRCPTDASAVGPVTAVGRNLPLADVQRSTIAPAARDFPLVLDQALSPTRRLRKRMNNATAPRTAQAVRTRAILSFTGTGEDTAAGGGEPPTWILPVASAALKYTTGRPSTMTTSDSENPPGRCYPANRDRAGDDPDWRTPGKPVVRRLHVVDLLRLARTVAVTQREYPSQRAVAVIEDARIDVQPLPPTNSQAMSPSGVSGSATAAFVPVTRHGPVLAADGKGWAPLSVIAARPSRLLLS